MSYEEFKDYKEVKDVQNPFSTRYEFDDCIFYIEPVFYTQFTGFKEHDIKSVPLIVNKMIEIVYKNKHVVFTGSFDYPQTVTDESFIYLEITDITDQLQIYVEDKSRGSDYGD